MGTPEIVREALADSARVKTALLEQTDLIAATARLIAERYRAGGRLYACGNGGSACDAMHLVEELVARYKADRPGLPAHHLLDAPTLTCWSNDYEFESVFERQTRTMVAAGDVFIGISTSGGSANVLRAVEAAREKGAATIGLSGRGGGELRQICDHCLVVPSTATERIQEAHITIIHIWCELLERMLFGDLQHELTD